MASSCSKQRDELMQCLVDSPCMKAGNSIDECSKQPEPDGCADRRFAFYMCKRGQLDMRKRIKGNMPKGDALTREVAEEQMLKNPAK